MYLRYMLDVPIFFKNHAEKLELEIPKYLENLDVDVSGGFYKSISLVFTSA